MGVDGAIKLVTLIAVAWLGEAGSIGVPRAYRVGCVYLLGGW